MFESDHQTDRFFTVVTVCLMFVGCMLWIAKHVWAVPWHIVCDVWPHACGVVHRNLQQLPGRENQSPSPCKSSCPFTVELQSCFLKEAWNEAGLHCGRLKLIPLPIEQQHRFRAVRYDNTGCWCHCRTKCQPEVVLVDLEPRQHRPSFPQHSKTSQVSFQMCHIKCASQT